MSLRSEASGDFCLPLAKIVSRNAYETVLDTFAEKANTRTDKLMNKWHTK